ncbi:MAG: hypothetical protein H7Z14_10810 [Anaerolineae bacterium]|nr:hypothetical protein [Phycisphaerae bacterium]
MIDFPCPCGRYTFSVPQDMAGGLVQCPECHRLCDVPTLGEMENLDDDGAYKLGPTIDPVESPQERLQKVARAFTRKHVDESGEEIDLRPSYEDVLAAGTDDGPTAVAGDVDMHAPQYDPMTGELIRPIDIKRDPNDRPQTVAAIPIASRAIQYEQHDLSRPIAFSQLALNLIRDPANLFVMSIVLAAHILMEPANVMMAAGAWLAMPVFVLGIMFFLSHYANVVEDAGPGEAGELPRPMRDVQFYDDLWRPFVNFTFSMIVCFWPAYVARQFHLPLPAIGCLAMVGSFFFPAVLLTMATSGTILNMRPDRLMGVIRIIGPSYILLFSLMFTALAAYTIGLWRFHADAILLFVWASTANQFRATLPWWFQPWLTYPALLAGVYLMHYFCWSLGAVYRLRHEQFPWVLQRHVRSPDDVRLLGRSKAPARNLNANSAKVKAAQSRAAAPPR